MSTENIYHFRNNITNTKGKILEDKVNYFADYFHISINNWGRPFVSELENHKSILEKVIFQLENYSNYSKSNINRYFESPLFRSDDLIIKHFFSKEWKKVIKWSKKEADFSSHNLGKAIKDLKDFVELLDKTLFQKCVDWLLTTLVCSKPLEDHSHIQIIECVADAMLAEFFYSGFRRDELKELFDKILDNKIDFNNGKPKTRIPLPKELHELKYTDTEKYFEDVSKFLENRDLKQQFMGIYNYLKNEQRDYTYVFKLDNTKSREAINLQYDTVLISNRLHKKYITKDSKGKYLEFFANHETILAEVTVRGTNKKEAKNNALRKVNNTVKFLSILEKEKININTLEYIEKERDSNSKYSFYPDSLFSRDKKKFNESNIHHVLRRHDNNLTRQLKDIEYIFINGEASEYKETKLVNLWRYLECFVEGGKVAEVVSSIVANNYSNRYVEFFMRSLDYIYDDFNNPPVFEKISIPREEFNSLLNEVRFKDYNLIRFSEVTNHPYITNELRSFISRDRNEKIDKVKKFYFRILNEAYEQRNFIEHEGKYNKKAVDKVLMSLSHVTTIFRYLMIVNSKNKSFESFDQIIEKLSKAKPYIKYNS